MPRLFLTCFLIGGFGFAQPASLHLRVDQFGYRTLDSKVAVLREPVLGFDAPAAYTPGPNLEIRRSGNQTVAFSAPITPWNGGAVDPDSGDRAWWADFSGLQENGSFYAWDPTNGLRSEDFTIGDDVFRPVLRAAVRMFYYQRCGVAKTAGAAGANWADAPCHVGAGQDLQCTSVATPGSGAARDLSGGWHDAGDFNKYINFADQAVHGLLYAFETAPAYFPDTFGIPESGNGVPDILDEVRWELEWMLRMQNSNGSVLHKVSVDQFQAASPASADSAPRYHAPATGSATVSAAGAFAHAALVFRTQPDASSQAFATQLQNAAVLAWNWMAQNPGSFPSSFNNAGFFSASAEDPAYEQEYNRIRAAVYLFALTGDPLYRAVVDQGYNSRHVFQWTWASPFEQDWEESLLVYSRLPGATPSVAAAIRTQYLAALQGHLSGVLQGLDPYRAPMGGSLYSWGSNRTKAAYGALFATASQYGLDASQGRVWADAAMGALHDLHGVNPTGHAFLTNMAGAGADGSVQEMYHAWFGHGTPWDNATTSPFGPPPGYLVGGPNPSFSPDPSYTGPPLVPPQNQPIRKSYRDWNTSWPENSWEVTEPHIPYQAAYVRLLAFAATAPTPRLALHVPDLPGGQTRTLSVGGVSPNALVLLGWSPTPGRFVFNSGTLCLDLGLSPLANPADQLLGIALAGPGGQASWTLGVPAGLAGFSLRLQAAEIGPCVSPRQSSVVSASLE